MIHFQQHQTVERDALKAECSRLQEEVQTLKSELLQSMTALKEVTYSYSFTNLFSACYCELHVHNDSTHAEEFEMTFASVVDTFNASW